MKENRTQDTHRFLSRRQQRALCIQRSLSHLPIKGAKVLHSSHNKYQPLAFATFTFKFTSSFSLVSPLYTCIERSKFLLFLLFFFSCSLSPLKSSSPLVQHPKQRQNTQRDMCVCICVTIQLALNFIIHSSALLILSILRPL